MQKPEPKQTVTTGEKIVDIISGIVDWVFIIFFLIILLFCLYAIYDSTKVYDDVKMPEIVSKYVEKTEDNSRKIDFDSLLAQNSDLVGWIVLDDTTIDYYVMQSDNNNSFYLSHGFDKQYLTSGSVLVDYRNNRGWGDAYNLVYGHNMNGNMMFGVLNQFHEKEYFDSHRTGKLYTPNGNYSLEVVAEMVADKNNQDIYNVMSYRNNLPAVLDYIGKNANQKRDLSGTEKIIALSTCKGSAGSRQVVFLKATKD